MYSTSLLLVAITSLTKSRAGLFLVQIDLNQALFYYADISPVSFFANREKEVPHIIRYTIQNKDVIMNKRTVVAGVIGIGLVLLLAGCTATPNAMVGTPAASGASAGFLLGIWHGLIVIFTFIGSLIWPGNVGIYEVHNIGVLYDAGFVLGLAILFGGGIFGGSRRR